jgi:excisionase family DNA binding protein
LIVLYSRKGIFVKRFGLGKYPLKVYTERMEGYITLAEAARRHGYSDPRTLRQAVHDGRIAGERIGNTWLVKEDSVREYVARTKKRRGRPVIKHGAAI